MINEYSYDVKTSKNNEVMNTCSIKKKSTQQNVFVIYFQEENV